MRNKSQNTGCTHCNFMRHTDPEALCMDCKWMQLPEPFWKSFRGQPPTTLAAYPGLTGLL